MKKLIEDPVIWQDYNIDTVIDKSSTHIFKISIHTYDKIAEQYHEVLSQEEIAKSTRFRQMDDAKRYIVGKFFLRIILSNLLDIQPSAIVFSYTKNKKPYIDGLHFNLSHSGNFIVIATSPFIIGIDIEYINKNFDFTSLLNGCFTERELDHIDHINDFYTFWTRKEAILKASGKGLINNLRNIDCSENFVTINEANFIIKSGYCDIKHIYSLVINTLCKKYQYWNIK